MEVTYHYKNLEKAEEEEFHDYFEKKVPMIDKFLKKFPEDAVVLKVSLERFEKHNAYEVELVLEIPSKNLVAKEVAHEITKAVDDSKDRLVDQIKKHLDHLRKERNHDSIREMAA